MPGADKPLLSVVVPSYCHESFVVGALESVYEQDYSRLELIVVDDCSRDRTAERIATFIERAEVKSRFERVVFVRHERNLGAHQAINRGIDEARGAYINLLNSDDLFAPRRLSILLERCRATGALLAFSQVGLLGADNPRLRSDVDFFNNLQDGLTKFPTVGYALLRNQVAISSGNLFFVRELFERVGPFKALKYCHDWDFVLRALLVTEPVFVPERLYFYRLHDTNSFQELRSVAETESEIVLKHYLFSCRNRPTQNALAPSPAWGPYFDAFLKTSQYERFLTRP